MVTITIITDYYNQSNRITVIEGLSELAMLEELYLDHNGITVIQGLDNNVNLMTLDLSTNKIAKLTNVSHLTKLEEFWFNNNQLENWHDVELLQNATNIKTVYFEHNPIARDNQYRRKLRLILPSLTQIDATLCV